MASASDPRAARAAEHSPTRIPVPEMPAPAALAEAHRQSLAVATSPHAEDDQAFIDAVSDRGDG
jgi:hypothetical protein